MKYSTSLKVWNNIAFADENSRLWHHRYDKTSHNWSLQCSVNAGHELWSISNRKATFSMKRPLQNTPAETPFESWGMKTKSTFRGLLQFIVITGDSSKENQHGKPEWLWRLPHSSLKEPEQAVWIGWLILRLIQQWKLNIGPTWEEPVWIWPWMGTAMPLVWFASLEVMFICSVVSPAAFSPCLHGGRATVKKRTEGSVHMQNHTDWLTRLIWRSSLTSGGRHSQLAKRSFSSDN